MSNSYGDGGVMEKLLSSAEVEALNLPEMEKELILMVGLPRSGKSTFAKEFIEKNPGTAIVNPDSIRLAVHGQRFIGSAEPVVWMVAKYMAKSLFLSGHHTVIIDATNNTQLRRDEWVNAFKGQDITVSCIFIGTSREDCIKRAKREGDEAIIPIIEKMATEADWMDMPFKNIETE